MFSEAIKALSVPGAGGSCRYPAEFADVRRVSTVAKRVINHNCGLLLWGPSDHRVMKIYGANALAGPTAAPTARRTSNGTFKLASEGVQAAAATGTLQTVSSIDALLALQGSEDATERRKRAVRKGRAALDALEDLKVALLSGAPEPENLRRLRVLGSEVPGETGDPRLDGVLGEIRLRVEVELAKAGIR